MSSALGPAVQSLTSSLALLRSATEILDSGNSNSNTSSNTSSNNTGGVADFPRLRRVLSTQQHFELLPEPQLRAAQQSVAGEIAPAISQLLATADKYVDELARRDAGLRARCELLSGRLSSSRRRDSRSRSRSGSRGRGGDVGAYEGDDYDDNTRSVDKVSTAVGFDDASKAKLLRQKKERLQYAIDRLELQLKQRERELRRSMAFVRE